MARWLLPTLALVGTMAWPIAASAQRNTAAAEALFNEAKAAMERQDFDVACQRFEASNRMDPAIGTLLNLAACERARGHAATAWELFRSAHRQLAANDPRREYAGSQAEELEGSLARLTLRLAESAPPGTVVKEGETQYDAATFGIALPVNPGRRTLEVAAPGHEPRFVEVEVATGEQKTVELAPGEKLAASTPSAKPANAAPERDAAVSTADAAGLPWGWILTGSGVAVLAAGGVTGVLALKKQDEANAHCSDTLEVCSRAGRDASDSGQKLALVSTVGWVAGAALTGVGVYFLLTSSPEGETAVVTRVNPGGGAVLVRTSF